MVRITQVVLLDRMLLLGPPGIGKTEVVRALARKEAEKLGKTFVDLTGEVSDEVVEMVRADPRGHYLFLRATAPTVFPEELSYPRERNSLIDIIPPKKLYLMTLPVHGVLFIDEITNVQHEAQITMFFSIIQEKEFSWGIKLSPNVKIVLAGNTPEWSEIVRAPPKPLRSKMTFVNVESPTVKEWGAYMEKAYGDSWEKLTLAYLTVNADELLKPPTDDWSNYPCPRNWTELALLLHELKKEGASEDFIEEVIIGRLGREVGTKFAAFLREGLTPEEMERLAQRPEAFFGLSVSKKILAVYSLANAPVEDLLSKYDALIEHIAQRDSELFVLLLRMMDNKKRLKYAEKKMSLVSRVAADLKDLLV
jgi:DNA polymerase III delta prime subunit